MNWRAILIVVLWVLRAIFRVAVFCTGLIITLFVGAMGGTLRKPPRRTSEWNRMTYGRGGRR